MMRSIKCLVSLAIGCVLSTAVLTPVHAQFSGSYTGPKPSASAVLDARAQHAKATLWPIAFVLAASDDASEVKAAFNQPRGTGAVQLAGGVYTKAVPNLGDTLYTYFYEIQLAKESCMEAVCKAQVLRRAKEQAQAVKAAPHPGQALMEWIQKNG